MSAVASAVLAPSSSRSQAAIRHPSTFLVGPPGLSTLRGAGITAAPIRRHHRALVVAAREDAAADAASTIKLDRRELLLAGSAAAVGGAGTAQATPVGDPDMKSCGPGEVTGWDQKNKVQTLLQIACCAPKAKGDTIDFKSDTGPLRTRLAAHTLDADYIDKYNRAYAAMRALPDSDPRSMKQQANVHCAYCNFAYRQQGDKKAQLQIHNGWLFLPWHRFYLYFHEKILGSLIGDPTFALPFWQWDDQEGGNEIPLCFRDETSALYDVNRNPQIDTTIVNLADFPNSDEKTSKATDPEIVKRGNISSMHQNVAMQAGAKEFMGGEVRYGDTESNAGGLENAPHTAVHIFTGNAGNPNGEDMGNFYSAGRDPVFYSHHSNVDRLWKVWLSMGRENWNEADFLNAEFLFFNEESKLVRCKVHQCLNIEDDMRYNYADTQASDDKWINYAPLSGRKALVAGSATVVGQSNMAMAAGYPTLSNVKVQGEPLARSVSQPKQSGAKDEILVLEGVEVPMNSRAGFDVFINFPEADKSTPISIAEYVGSVYNVPHVMPGMSPTETRISNSRFSILQNVKTLGVTDASELTVTLVPKGDETIKVKSARIEYYS